MEWNSTDEGPYEDRFTIALREDHMRIETAITEGFEVMMSDAVDESVDARRSHEGSDF